jgi:hypothetical protein
MRKQNKLTARFFHYAAKQKYGLKLYQFFQFYHGSEIRLFDNEFRQIFGFAASKKRAEIAKILKETNKILVQNFGNWTQITHYSNPFDHQQMWHCSLKKVDAQTAENIDQIEFEAANDVAESAKKILEAIPIAKKEAEKKEIEAQFKLDFAAVNAGSNQYFKFKQKYWQINANQNLICVDTNRLANLNEIKEFYLFQWLKYQESQKNMEIAA